MSRVCAIKTKEIQNGSYLMKGNTRLHTWNSDLDELTYGNYMFNGCSNLTTFTAVTPMLREGSRMFNLQSKTNKTSSRIKMDFDELTDGYYMFADCYNLHLISNEIVSSSFRFPKLTSGYCMFANTSSVKVYSPNSEGGEKYGYMTFPELLDATEMFKNNKDVSGVYDAYMFPKVRCFNEAFAYSYISSFESNQLYRGCTTGLPSCIGLSDNHSEFKYMFKDSRLTNFYVALSSDLPSASYYFDCEGMFQNCKRLATVRWDNSFGVHVRSSMYLFKGCDVLTTIECDLPYMTSADYFGLENNQSLVTYKGDLSGLRSGGKMFSGCISLTNFTSSLSQCESGRCMFDGCKNLENFYSPSLGGGSYSTYGQFSDAYGMFRGCHSLKNFGDDVEVFGGYYLPYLRSAASMFERCASLKEVDCMFPVLEDGHYMFCGCSSLTSFNGDLSYLTNASHMFDGCKKLTSLTYKRTPFNMSYMLDLEDADCMFYGCSSLDINSFSAIFGCTSAYYMFAGCYNLGSVVDVRYKSNNQDMQGIVFHNPLQEGEATFKGCKSMTTFYGNLSSLTNGIQMFEDCYNLEVVAASSVAPISLKKLTQGKAMFKHTDLETFNIEDNTIPALTHSYEMFAECFHLASFNVSMPSLQRGENMFRYCTELESFDSDLSSLTHGNEMFEGCTSLTSFNANLSSLTNGNEMFHDCRLDYTSFRNIINSLPTYSGGSHTIHITVQYSPDVVEGFSTDSIFAGETRVLIPKVHSSSYETTYKGWRILLSASEQFIFDVNVDQTNERDIVIDSDYIPDASGWYVKHGNTNDIVAVYNGHAYDAEIN